MTTSSDEGYPNDDQDNQSHTDIIPHFGDDSDDETGIPQIPIKQTSALPKKMLMWLIVISPNEQRGTVLPVVNNSVIGRQGSLTWHDSHMSRQHARFILIDDPNQQGHQVFGIEPVKDRNGTLVNGRKIRQLTPLRENDILQMGSTHFIVKVLL